MPAPVSDRRSYVLCAAITLSLCLLATRAAAQDPPPKHESLKLLERFVGTWEDQITIRQSAWSPQERTGTGSVVAKWTLDGRFVELRTSSKLDNAHALHLMGHDMNTDTLRQWFFHSHGFNHISIGTWDEKAKTLTWVSEFGTGVKGTGTDRFIDNDNREWHFVIKDGNGDTLFEMSGKSKRVKQK
jgi:hypothetical protein